MGNGIEHYLAPCDGPLPQVLGHWMPPMEGHRLIHLGAIYARGKRGAGNTRVSEGDWIRVHRRPKRFYPFGQHWLPWWEEHQDFVVAYKPAGIPMHSSLDNLWENLQRKLEMEMHQKLFTAGRLDVATQGLVTLGKNADFVRRFHQFKERWRKGYRALVSTPQLPGRYTHYMDRSQRYPYRLTLAPEEGRVECILDILSCHPVPGGWELEIELVTGRTHQIRAQLATLGSPLKGDRVYGSGVGDPRWIALQCFRLEFDDHRFEWSSSPWNAK